MERRVLLEEAAAEWRMGHGSPAPYELLNGAGWPGLTVEALNVIRGLVAHEKFVFVASEPRALDLLTVGHALRPLEYAVVQRLDDRIRPFLDTLRMPGRPLPGGPLWDGEALSPRDWLVRFRDDVAPKVVVGVYRAGLLAPPQLFYAHEDHAHTAAAIAVADSVADDRRGFPMLIDLADQACRGVDGAGGLRQMIRDAFFQSGAPFRYASERPLRP
jgi:hypothetical protein